LLQEIYNSLDKELNQFSEISPIISQALKLNDNNLNQHSVFAIININKGAKLELKETDISEIIKSLNNHLQKFTQFLQMETNNYLFELEKNSQLQKELETLLDKLVKREKS
jgi:hypothetical protein